MLVRVANKTTRANEDVPHPMTWASIDRSLCNSSLYPSTTLLTSTGSSVTKCGRVSTTAVGGVVNGRSCNSWRKVGHQRSQRGDIQVPLQGEGGVYSIGEMYY